MNTTVDKELLKDTVLYLVNFPKGILAADESATTCCKRFEGVNLECNDESRRAFREMILTAPNLENNINGVILTDETIHQSTKDGKPFTHVLIEKGIKVGIKVDEGLIGFRSEDDSEKITKGIEGLAKRMPEYKELGASFAKWRSAFAVGPNIPSNEVLKKNIVDMIEYIKICQLNDIVPIVEPEVLMDGKHDISEMQSTLRNILKVLFAEIEKSDVYLPGIILKTSFVLSGKDAENRADAKMVAEKTTEVLRETVPDEIGGVVFLSGGQSHEETKKNFSEMMKNASKLDFPIVFSFSRAFQNDSLAIYAKNPETECENAQKVLVESILDIVNYK